MRWPWQRRSTNERPDQPEVDDDRMTEARAARAESEEVLRRSPEQDRAVREQVIFWRTRRKHNRFAELWIEALQDGGRRRP